MRSLLEGGAYLRPDAYYRKCGSTFFITICWWHKFWRHFQVYFFGSSDFFKIMYHITCGLNFSRYSFIDDFSSLLLLYSTYTWLYVLVWFLPFPRTNRVKVVEGSLMVYDMVYSSRRYHFKFFKDCLPQILIGSFLNILTQMWVQVLVWGWVQIWL